MADKKLSEEIEGAISASIELTAAFFQGVLAENRSLRKDDVRSRRSQEMLLQNVKTLVKP